MRSPEEETKSGRLSHLPEVSPLLNAALDSFMPVCLCTYGVVRGPNANGIRTVIAAN